MKRKLLAFSMTLALLLSVFSVANVGAHTITIETTASKVPSRTDWFGLQGNTGTAIVQRNSAQQGEVVFNDASKDQRIIVNTDPVTRAADLDWFSVTADANNINFLAKVDTYQKISQSPAIELMITIDRNQTAGQGTLPLPLPNSFTAVNVPSDAAWEYALDVQFKPGAPNAGSVPADAIKIYTDPTTSFSCAGCAAQLASQSINKGGFVEISAPWAAFTGAGIKPAGATNTLRFTVATMYQNRKLPNDGFNSPVIDVLGTTNNTLADIQDGTINTSFDVHFDTNPAPINPTYEPYAPLLVSEFQPNPIGPDSPGPTNTSKDTEWIEIYNPNSFSINLTDYKIGNAAKRGSSQAMLRFKSGTIGSKATIIVAREKKRFTDGRPGVPAGIVYDESTDLTPYTAWATGTPIDLANQADPGQTSFEEQLILLDAKDDIVDLVNYGNKTPHSAGNVPIFTSFTPAGVSYERCPASLDTNGGFVDGINDPATSTDFVVHGTPSDQSPGSACLGRPGIDMAMAKTADVNNGTPGDPVVFTLSYGNVGSQDEFSGATVTVTDTLPAGLTFVSATPAPTNVNGKTLTWSNLTPPSSSGFASTIQVNTTIDAGVAENTALVNRAGISSPNEPTNAQQPGARDNNTAEATVTTIGPAQLHLSFDGLGRKTPPNAQFTFALNYDNTGQEDAADTTITLNVPANVTIVSADAPEALANFTAPIVGPTSLTWSISNVASGTNGRISLTARVGSGVAEGSTLSFSATAASLAANPNTVQATGANSQTVAFNRLYLPMIIK